MAECYDESEKMQALFKKKQEMRKEAKEYFRKMINSPYVQHHNKIPFDPVAFRYCTLSSYQIEHYRPTPKTTAYFLGFVAIPIALTYFVLSWSTRRRLRPIENGEVAYKDREFQMLM